MQSIFSGDEEYYIKTSAYDNLKDSDLLVKPLSSLEWQYIYDMFVKVVEHDIGINCHKMAYVSHMLLKRDYGITKSDELGTITIKTSSHIKFTIHIDTDVISWHEEHELERLYPKLKVRILTLADVYKRFHILLEEGKVNNIVLG